MVLETEELSVEAVTEVIWIALFCNLIKLASETSDYMIENLLDTFRRENMKELITVDKTLLIDRGRKKIRMNYIRNGSVVGYIVPI